MCTIREGCSGWLLSPGALQELSRPSTQGNIFSTRVPLEIKQKIWGITSLGDGKAGFVLLKVIDMPEHNPGDLGGTMRLGLRRTVFTTENSLLSKYPRALICTGHEEWIKWLSY